MGRRNDKTIYFTEARKQRFAKFAADGVTVSDVFDAGLDALERKAREQRGRTQVQRAVDMLVVAAEAEAEQRVSADFEQRVDAEVRRRLDDALVPAQD